MEYIESYVQLMRRAKNKKDAINEISLAFTLKNGIMYTIVKDKDQKVIYTNTMKGQDLFKNINKVTARKESFATAMLALDIREKEWDLVDEFITVSPVSLEINMTVIITWTKNKKGKFRYELRYTKNTWAGVLFLYDANAVQEKVNDLMKTPLDINEYETEFDSFLQLL